MSKSVQRNGGASAPSRAVDEGEAICPVCKSSRYLNPNMKFLVNPECYHKMCETCVERIFSHGPSQCPIAGCKKTLRRQRFRKQTFEDIAVEREVDIRKRVAEVFNQRQEDFETLLDYNNYLEDVETVTFELVNGINVAENERKLAAHKEKFSKAIKTNAARATNEVASVRAREAAEKEQAKMRRQAARLEEEEERNELEQQRRQIIDSMAKGEGNAADIMREGETKLKRSLARRSAVPDKQKQGAVGPMSALNGGADDTFVIRGLKGPSKKEKPEPEKPYDPFGGLTYTPRYYSLARSYDFGWINDAQANEAIMAGGYDINAYYQRALCDAFAGLGVFLEDEVAEGKKEEPIDKGAANNAAAMAVNEEDTFG